MIEQVTFTCAWQRLKDTHALVVQKEITLSVY